MVSLQQWGWPAHAEPLRLWQRMKGAGDWVDTRNDHTDPTSHKLDFVWPPFPSVPHLLAVFLLHIVQFIGTSTGGTLAERRGKCKPSKSISLGVSSYWQGLWNEGENYWQRRIWNSCRVHWSSETVLIENWRSESCSLATGVFILWVENLAISTPSL